MDGWMYARTHLIFFLPLFVSPVSLVSLVWRAAKRAAVTIRTPAGRRTFWWTLWPSRGLWRASAKSGASTAVGCTPTREFSAARSGFGGKITRLHFLKFQFQRSAYRALVKNKIVSESVTSRKSPKS